jgi:hypothetical protein
MKVVGTKVRRNEGNQGRMKERNKEKEFTLSSVYSGTYLDTDRYNIKFSLRKPEFCGMLYFFPSFILRLSDSD